jgi:alpha-tubulin suppressor-like RCC1 family protein
LVLNNKGLVYSFGNNQLLQLGLGSEKMNKNIPTLIPLLNNIVQISAGYTNSLVINNIGKYSSFGDNNVLLLINYLVLSNCGCCRLLQCLSNYY